MGSDDDASDDDMEGSYGGEEDGESSVEEDMGPAKGKKKKNRDQDSSSDVDAKEGIYKAPKLTPVAYEDKADKKAKSKDAYEKKKLGKSELIQEMRKELADEPEEVYMGVGKKSKAAKYAQMVEDAEMDNFRRYQMTNK